MDNIQIKNAGFTVEWGSIDAIVNHLRNAKTVLYDPLKQQYVVDGVVIDNKFFSECILKASYFINTLSAVQMANKVIVNIDTLQRQENK